MTCSIPAGTLARLFTRSAGTVCAALLVSGAQPAEAQSLPPTLTSSYNLMGPATTHEALLSSYVDCGFFRCDIGYSILTAPVDRLVKVEWRDASGAVLVSGTNTYLSNFYAPQQFGGYIQTTEWRKGVSGGAVLNAQPLQATGTADFTGTSPGPDPCGVG